MERYYIKKIHLDCFCASKQVLKLLQLEIYADSIVIVFSTGGWFTPPTFYKMGVCQYRKVPVTHLNRYINITADEWLSISCAMQNQKKF